ncbi:MAG: tetratricopeptide repeat protein [Capsulimonadales bacterium]|nr:tetratricopeptide repeat protein [Capsulimonadales bacterium]
MVANSALAQTTPIQSSNPPGVPKTATTPPTEPLPEVAALIQAGKEEATKFQWEEALIKYRTALERSRTLSDKTGEGVALTSIGMVFASTGQPDKALEHYEQALPLLRMTGSKLFEANTLNNIGNVHATTGQPDKALEHYRLAFPLYHETGNRAREGAVLANMGVVFADSGQPDKALEHYEQALPLLRMTGSKPFEANTLNNTGNVLVAIGQPGRALQLFQQALSLYRETENNVGAANALNGMGNVYVAIRQPVKALEYFRQTLALYRQAGFKAQEAGVLANIGAVLSDMGQPDKALEHYEQALPLLRMTGSKLFEANTLNNIGNVHASTGRTRKALENYEQALSFYQRLGNTAGEANTLSGIGNVYRDAGQAQKALEYYRRSISGIEAVRSRIQNDTEARSAFLEGYLATYHLAIHLLLREGTLPARLEAFELAQKVKARSLLDRLGNAKNDLVARLTPEERDKEAGLRVACDRLNRAMVAEGVRNEIGSKKRFEQAKSALTKAEQQLALFQDSLYARYPDLSARRVARTDSLTDIARALPEDTALIEFVRLNDGKKLDRTVAFVVTRVGKRPRLTVYDTGRDGKSLTDLARRLNGACARPSGNYILPARKLHAALLGPAAKPLVGKRSLIVCPDGDLWKVPFAALRDARGRFLLQRYDLSVAYSATGWRAARTVRTIQKRAKSPLSGRLLTLADPDFGSVNRLAAEFGNTPGVQGQRPISIPDRPISIPDRPISIPDRPISIPDRAVSLGLIERAGALRALPGTRNEARAIQKLFPDATLLTGRQAQESTFKQQAPRYGRLHLATHGFFNDASPLLSSLVLAAPPDTGAGSDEDGLLTAREILGLDLSRCEMAVLSACSTGVGKQQSGEGIVGLTWCLTASGCPSQIVSGWPVSDASTARLMREFYGGLKRGQSKAASLRSASLALLKSSATSHPYHWAPFFLVGDPN